MKISIGIMLWNEEKSIGMTIDSIFDQTLFTEYKSDIESVELVALANGCTDQSIPRAREAFARNLQKCGLSYVTARVEELPKGRSPAWNRFVHDLSYPDTDYIILMDADIIINNSNSIWSMVKALSETNYHPVAGALGIKDVDINQRRTIIHKLTSAATRMEHDVRFFYLCGGLYCGKSEFLRRIVFPKGFICGDDAFIATLAITNFWTTEYQFDRILHPEDATFVFEAYSTIPQVFKQNRRRMIGARVRKLIQDYVQSKQKDIDLDAGMIIKNACEEDPEWLEKSIEEMIKRSGFWVIPKREIFFRLTQLRHIPWWKKLLRLPIACAATIWQLALVVSANRVFQRREHAGAWTNNQNTRLRSTAEEIAK